MVYVDGFGDADEDYFRELIMQFENHDDWTYEEPEHGAYTLDDLPERAANWEMSEPDFRHDETGAYMSLMFPDEELKIACHGTVTNTLMFNPGTEPPEQFLSHDLEKAYRKIADNHTTEYASRSNWGRENDIDLNLMSFRIPLDYDPELLQQTLDEMSAAATDAHELNQAMRRPLDDFLEEK